MLVVNNAEACMVRSTLIFGLAREAAVLKLLRASQPGRTQTSQPASHASQPGRIPGMTFISDVFVCLCVYM